MHSNIPPACSNPPRGAGFPQNLGRGRDGINSASAEAPKPASPATVAAQGAVAAAPPADDGTAFATRGFIATRADPLIRNSEGKPV